MFGLRNRKKRNSIESLNDEVQYSLSQIKSYETEIFKVIDLFETQVIPQIDLPSVKNGDIHKYQSEDLYFMHRAIYDSIMPLYRAHGYIVGRGLTYHQNRLKPSIVDWINNIRLKLHRLKNDN